MAQDEFGREEAEAIERARIFAHEIVRPEAIGWELERRMPRDAMEIAGEAELCGLIVPREVGGAGFGIRAFAHIVSEVAREDLGFAFALVVQNNVAGAIAARGSDAQRHRYLDDLMAGRQIGAFLLTEPHGGSDAAALRTTARERGVGWRIEGEKAWATNASVADVASLYVQTRPADGWRGIACFLVSLEGPGIERVGPYTMMGAHATGAGGFLFKEAPVAREALMVPPGEGFKAAMAGIDLARVTVAMMCAAMMEAAIEHAAGHAAGREVFGRRVIDHQGLRWQLADVATDAHAARVMADHAARLIDAGADAVLAAAHAKKFATRAALPGLAQCMQAMGADGFRHEHPLARQLAAAKMAQYLGGTTEIQNVVIARALFGRESG